MVIYEYFKKNIFGTADPSFFKKLMAGGIAGAVGCIFGTPADVLKIRLINDIQGIKYRGLVDCFNKTV